MSKPIAVLISDIHFNITNLELSTKALKSAIKTADDLDVQLIVAGDLQDNKAIIRAEVANRLLEVFRDTQYFARILVGNHDLINEKGEDNALEYLRSHACIYAKEHLTYLGSGNTPVYLIPYQNSSDKFMSIVKDIPKDNIIIMHQGIKGAFMGDYVQDKTSIDPEVLKDYKVFSGHYHRHQTVGTVTYIGNPFTMSFGEANDGPKGFLVLNDDGSYARVILDDIRKHIVVERDLEDLFRPEPGVDPEDKLWIKVKGPRSELSKVQKANVGQVFLGHSDFKLDLIPIDDKLLDSRVNEHHLTPLDIMDIFIDATAEAPEQKIYLKELCREIIEGHSN